MTIQLALAVFVASLGTAIYWHGGDHSHRAVDGTITKKGAGMRRFLGWLLGWYEFNDANLMEQYRKVWQEPAVRTGCADPKRLERIEW